MNNKQLFILILVNLVAITCGFGLNYVKQCVSPHVWWWEVSQVYMGIIAFLTPVLTFSYILIKYLDNSMKDER